MKQHRQTGPRSRSRPADWLWKSAAVGILTMGLLCTALAGLIHGGALAQSALPSAGQAAAALGVLAAGLCCARMAAERKLFRTSVCCGALLLGLVLGNVLLPEPFHPPLAALAGAAAAAAAAALRASAPKRRAQSRK